MIIHHPDGYLTDGNDSVPLAFVKQYHPDYGLPAGMIGRQFDPNGNDTVFTSDSQFVGPGASEVAANFDNLVSLYKESIVVKPEPIGVPFSVTMRQARIVLALQPSPDNAFPNLLAYVLAQFDQLPEPDRTIADITFEYSTEVQRNNPLIAQVAAMGGLTDEQIDEMFIQAATL